MKRIAEIKQRLERWGCWAASGRTVARSSGVSSFYRFAGMARSAGDRPLWSTVVPYDELEAIETEGAVRQLDVPDRRLAVVAYVRAPAGTLVTWGLRVGLGKSAVYAGLCRIDCRVFEILTTCGNEKPNTRQITW